MSGAFFRKTLAVAMGVGVLSGAPGALAETTTGFLIPNAWLDQAGGVEVPITGGGDFWTFNDPWFHDFSRATFKTSATNTPGFFAAEVSPRDLLAEPNVLALSDYNPGTTKLTGLTFADPWRLSMWGEVPTTGDYNYYIELTIDTTAGFYRASTQKLNNPFVNTTEQLGFVFNWEDGGFLGDPFAGGGIPLAQINGMTYNVFMEVITPVSGGDGWFGVEGFNVEYEVTSAVTTLVGDLDGDGFVGISDLNLVLGNWNLTIPPGDHLADPSGDNFVGIEDLNTVLGNWNAGTPPIVTVPEPANLTLLIICGLAALHRR